MSDAAYSLAWPRDLFVWEARRVLSLGPSDLSGAISLLLTEAFEDADVASAFGAFTGASLGSFESLLMPIAARRWLDDLLRDESRLLPHVAPVYWAERQGDSSSMPSEAKLSFAYEFIELLCDFQEADYFPRALPRDCVDDPVDTKEITRRIRAATKQAIDWPIHASNADALPQSALFSLVEFFNDQAQRPRVIETIHTYADCGPHYGSHNRQSGGAVYRWRVNALLQSHSVGLKLASTGTERGRLVRHFDSALDDLADAQMRQRTDDPHDEVAHAVRGFRERGASLPQKRAALALLAGMLELRRLAIRDRISKPDESDLFKIANNFAIRHRNDAQKTDYGEEFLDWIFWSYLSMIDLVDGIERRTA